MDVSVRDAKRGREVNLMKTTCQVCMHHCALDCGQTGICGVRRNESGVVICKNYGQVTSLALDPIEKKPLRMFYPKSRILSVGSFGCNLKCPFCQNHEISMQRWEVSVSRKDRGSVFMSPQELANKALECKPAGNIGVAFTYNEPLVGWEYVRDAAKLVKASGMKTVLVTNGTASIQVLEEILPYIDAMNIDLKGFQYGYYRKLGGDFDTVKQFIIRAAAGCHIELTTLIVPGENDGQEQMEEEAKWIASIRPQGPSIPLHITRFFPRYHMAGRPATEVSVVYALAEIAGRYLEHVFVGNC